MKGGRMAGRMRWEKVDLDRRRVDLVQDITATRRTAGKID